MFSISHTDRGENHDPTGTLITAQALNGGLDCTAQRPWLTLEWLPKYAPELNDIARCWCDLKQYQFANRTFADADALAHAVPDAVARLNHERQLNSSPLRRQAA